jgi:magnesium transporter
MKHATNAEKWKDLVESDVNQGATVFSEQPFEEASKIAGIFGVPYFVNIVSKVRTDTAAGVLRNLPETFREEVIEGLVPEKINDIREILSYKVGTAGALMAKEYLSIPLDMTIGQTIQYLRDISQEKKGKVSYIYVVDKNDRLLGVIQVRDLVFHAPDQPIKEILKGPVVQVETGMSQLDVAKLLERHRYLGLPVVNEAQKLVGIISTDNVMRVFEQEAVEDLARVIGTSAEEIQAHSVAKILRLRLPWLLISIISGLACAFISGLFENSFQTIALLFLFVPIVLGLSESTGVQGATIVVRNMAIGDASFSRLGALFFREAWAGVFIGSICGTIVGAVAYLWKANPMLGLALASSMSLTIIVSALIGLVLPVIFKSLKIDPAMASGPFVLAVCDVQTLLIYFNLSSVMMRG